MYATLILPLAAPGTYTYQVPTRFEKCVHHGSRVIVQFGPRRYYTGIILALHDANPMPEVKTKPLADVMDQAPIVLPAQTHLWQWLAHYYMCTIGEVMKAALPSGLKPESETRLIPSPTFDPLSTTLSPDEERILRHTAPGRGKTVVELAREANLPNPLAIVHTLLKKGALAVRETLAQTYKPRRQTLVALAPQLFDQERLNTTLDTLQRAPRQQALLLRYLDLSAAPAALTLGNDALLRPVAKSTLCPDESTTAALNLLRKKGILQTTEHDISRLSPTTEASPLAPGKPLNKEQTQALQAINQSFRSKNVCLLHGVTSSGKTEVYIHLISQYLAQGKQVLYLVPEIALTTQLTARLARIFGTHMGVYHSKYPDSERVELWQKQLSATPYPLILGVRSSLFLPYQNLGLIIVDEEHETSYKQSDPAPRYHARDTAIVLAAQVGAHVLLGTATPAIETYHNALSGKYALVEMKQRYGGVSLPRIEVADIKELQRKKLISSPLSPPLIQAIHTALHRGEQAILFQNRRGYAPVLECHTCGWTPRCTKCDVSLTYHKALGKLVCHYCGATYDLPQECPACQGTQLSDHGYGTERIEDEARRLLPEARTERMDLDTTRTRAAHEQIIARFERGETNLLIGTQMVTKGLDFDRVSVVGIVNADQMLATPDYRAGERTYQMLSQVAGRAGRRGSRGLVVLQTRQPHHPVLQQTVSADYRAMYHSQIAERSEYLYPPFCRLIVITLRHRNDDVVAHAAAHIAALLRPHFGANLLGPDRPVVARIQTLYLRKIIVKILPSLPASGVRRTLLAARDATRAHAVYRSVSIQFDVDP